MVGRKDFYRSIGQYNLSGIYLQLGEDWDWYRVVSYATPEEWSCHPHLLVCVFGGNREIFPRIKKCLTK